MHSGKKVVELRMKTLGTIPAPNIPILQNSVVGDKMMRKAEQISADANWPRGTKPAIEPTSQLAFGLRRYLVRRAHISLSLLPSLPSSLRSSAAALPLSSPLLSSSAF